MEQLRLKGILIRMALNLVLAPEWRAQLDKLNRVRAWSMEQLRLKGILYPKRKSPIR